MKNGEVALYTDEGDCIHFKRGNKLEIKSNKLSIVHNAKDKNEPEKIDLVSVLYDVVNALDMAMTSTMLGPQPLSTKAIFAEAKTKIKRFINA